MDKESGEHSSTKEAIIPEILLPAGVVVEAEKKVAKEAENAPWQPDSLTNNWADIMLFGYGLIFVIMIALVIFPEPNYILSYNI